MKLITVIALLIGSSASAFEIPTPRERASDKKPHPCECKCEVTGQCACSSCNVGCGFIAPIPKTKKLECENAHCREHPDGSLSWVAADGYRYSYDAATVRQYGLLALLPVIESATGSCATGPACASGSCATGAEASGSCAGGSCSGTARRGLFRRR